MAENIHDLYALAGLAGSVHRGRYPALVVVDFSTGFTNPAVQIGADMQAQVEATAHLISVLRESSAPIIFTTIAFGDQVPYTWLDKVPGLAVLRQGSELVDIDSRLPRRQGDPVITKTGASVFFGTDLASLLRAYGADTVMICGATTSGCVRASAVDSVQYGFPTLVVSDGVADRTLSVHEASLFDLQAKYADVISLEEAVAYARSVTAESMPPTAPTHNPRNIAH